MDVTPDDVILNCYRLADRFHQSPRVFLEMPMSEIDMHIYWTIELIKKQRDAADNGDD